ncbi:MULTISPECIES: Hsp20/alpha crystallin family protein [Streptosporangium]|uniref:Hsp20/alpha crystallin family protein n=1 Tax=Streptosporangium jomthongense TaxID=1193683 RepID=A0ABV8FAL6_9ACTN
MNTLVRGGSTGLFPEIFGRPGSPLAEPWPTAGQPIRLEDYVEDDRYVLRAELPGIDPGKDLKITLTGGVLTVRAERRRKGRDGHRTEFRYGTFSRSIALPPAADAKDVKATYAKGILTVSVRLTRVERPGMRTPVENPTPRRKRCA